MLKRHSDFFKNLLFVSDLFLISGAWVAAYFLRMEEVFFPLQQSAPPLGPYLWLLIPIVVIWGAAFQGFQLYRPRRLGSHLAEVWDLTKANALSILVLVSLTFFVKQFEYSRLVFLYFGILNLIVLGASRMAFREVLRVLRRAGLNQRHALVLGAGRLGQRIVRSLKDHPELGISVHGYLTRNPEKMGQRLEGVEVIGTLEELEQYVHSGMDLVFVCLPREAEDAAEKLLGYLATTMVDVKVIPSIFEFVTLRPGAEMFEGLPILTLQGSPLYGWNRLAKRSVDVAGAFLAMIVGSPFFLVIAAAIKLDSKGPVLYRQTRMGLDGKAFSMVKFRTMKPDAESATGAVWAQPHDDRRTGIGKFLRRTSLDELPQLWNVLKGEMSLVGPRPERPEFIARFRERFPQYMLRHKMKAGMTGWAQVNGWRGSTDLEQRLAYDMYYIEHWSLWFDFQILTRTLVKMWREKNAY